MKITKTLRVADRAKWRAWLKKHHAKGKEIWLIFYKKHTKKETMSYNDAVEEAVCFGWIDNMDKGIDEETYALRFTPRKIGSTWSESNIARARKMIQAGKMRPAGLRQFKTR